MSFAGRAGIDRQRARPGRIEGGLAREKERLLRARHLCIREGHGLAGLGDDQISKLAFPPANPFGRPREHFGASDGSLPPDGALEGKLRFA